eukprot:tig00000404_g388.t1
MTTHAFPVRAPFVVHYPERSSKKQKQTQHIDEIIRFCLPEGEVHPRVNARLAILALHGPIDPATGTITGGFKGHWKTVQGRLEPIDNQVKMQDYHMRTLIEVQEKDDVVEVYAEPGKFYSAEERQAIVNQAPAHVRYPAQYEAKDVRAVLAGIPVDEDGRMEFGAVQKAILADRDRRIKDLRELLPDLRRPFALAEKPRRARVPPEVSPALLTTMNLRSQKIKISDTDSTLLLRMLHRDSHRICQLSDANSPEIVQNVKIIRPPALPTFAAVRPTKGLWDETCCMTQTQKGTYVKSKNFPVNKLHGID